MCSERCCSRYSRAAGQLAFTDLSLSDTDLWSVVFMSDAKNSFVYVGQYFRLINIGK